MTHCNEEGKFLQKLHSLGCFHRYFIGTLVARFSSLFCLLFAYSAKQPVSCLITHLAVTYSVGQ